MYEAVDGGPASIHADFSGLARHEFVFLSGQGVVKTDGHFGFPDRVAALLPRVLLWHGIVQADSILIQETDGLGCYLLAILFLILDSFVEIVD